ncbi:hypothetical protein PROFUN_13104 [Planoprotostelium fungivorum]|uniref:Protein Lines N-terminal domain-containing protein n=1 Tax=Planoprotostelium fungivorum TaxID=1890364 RepID=A0A2P6N5D2_9EUKA|nr:hypothetical protein PROFUN_13104 [Planoprotostelium fungivorum]
MQETTTNKRRKVEDLGNSIRIIEKILKGSISDNHLNVIFSHLLSDDTSSTVLLLSLQILCDAFSLPSTTSTFLNCVRSHLARLVSTFYSTSTSNIIRVLHHHVQNDPTQTDRILRSISKEGEEDREKDADITCLDLMGRLILHRHTSSKCIPPLLSFFSMFSQKIHHPDCTNRYIWLMSTITSLYASHDECLGDWLPPSSSLVHTYLKETNTDRRTKIMRCVLSVIDLLNRGEVQSMSEEMEGLDDGISAEFFIVSLVRMRGCVSIEAKLALLFQKLKEEGKSVLDLFLDRDDKLITVTQRLLQLYKSGFLAGNELIPLLKPFEIFHSLLNGLGHDPNLVVDMLLSTETTMLECMLQYTKELSEDESQVHHMHETSLETLRSLHRLLVKSTERGLFPFNISPLTRRIEMVLNHSGHEG